MGPFVLSKIHMYISEDKKESNNATPSENPYFYRSLLFLFSRRSQSNETEPKINLTQSNPICRIVNCSIGSVIERTGTFRGVPLPNSIEPIELNRRFQSDFVRHKDKRHPVSNESEISPSTMYVKQFETKNISVNPELTKIFVVKVFQNR